MKHGTRNSSLTNHDSALSSQPTGILDRVEGVDILLPAGWPRPQGYSNGVAASGRLVFVAGQIGWDQNGLIVSENLSAQVTQALSNVVAVLRSGGAEPENIVRMTWYFVDRAEYLQERPAIGESYRSVIGKHFPAMSLIFVNGLLEQGAKVEIETTAVVP